MRNTIIFPPDSAKKKNNKAYKLWVIPGIAMRHLKGRSDGYCGSKVVAREKVKEYTFFPSYTFLILLFNPLPSLHVS